MEEGFMEYLKNNRKYQKKESDFEEDLEDFDDVQEQDEFRPRKRTSMEEVEDIDERPVYRKPQRRDSLSEQVEAIKETLYKKIDVCFMKYGLNGLKLIDEAIADTMTDYIDRPKSVVRPQATERIGMMKNEEYIRSRVPTRSTENLNIGRTDESATSDVTDEDSMLMDIAGLVESSEPEQQEPSEPVVRTKTTGVEEPPVQEKKESDTNVSIDLGDVGNILGNA